MIAIPGPPHVISQNTSHTIRQISDFDNKWMIQTNLTKFEVFNISQQKTTPIIIDDEQIDDSNNAKY